MTPFVWIYTKGIRLSETHGKKKKRLERAGGFTLPDFTGLLTYSMNFIVDFFMMLALILLNSTGSS